ncbi:MAG TPA: FAD-dependent oxidoreductase, partial [Thermodesulfobacteriota bacterium]|nr:FAD-dependent oxidoreductase [Thermodesulfobacteriota bacterium]
MSGMKEIAVIGGGLAGCEAAAQIVRLGGRVILYEMKPLKFSPAHRLSGLAELVCSNSLKSDSLTNASGLLKEEMRRLSSLIVLAAEAERVPAGGSLSVDRLKFSSFITGYLEKAGVRIVREEIRRLPDLRPLIIATGPLTSDAFADELKT